MDSQKERLDFLSKLPLLWFSLAFLAGIAVAFWLGATLWLWLSLVAFLILAALFLRKRVANLRSLWLLASIAFCLGAARYQVAQPAFDSRDLAYYNDHGGWRAVRGVIITPPVLRENYIEIRVDAMQLTFEGETIEIKGVLLARIDHGQDWQYGDLVMLHGELITPADNDDFSYRAYLTRQGIYSLMPFAAAERLASNQGNPFWKALYAFRARSIDVAHRLYPGPEGALLAGILLGDESGLSESLKTAFNDTGTRHIIAISGFNISIIAGLLLALFTRWLGLRRAIWMTVSGIGVYTLLVGADASVVRAAIMGSLALVARQVGRQQVALNTLAFTAAMMALFNPLLLWDVGFQLSFAATLGLIVYAEPLRNRAEAWLKPRLNKEWLERLRGPLTEFVFLTIAAQITTLPLLVYHFQRLSWLSLPANLLILPIQPAMMILSGLSVLLGLIWLPLGALLAIFAWPLAAYTIRIVSAFAALPWVAQDVEFFSFGFVVLYYIVLVVFTVPSIRARVSLPRVQPATGLAVLAALVFWTWSAALSAPNGLLQITLLDSEREYILIETASGRRILINSAGGNLTSELGQHISPLTRQPDWVLISEEKDEGTALGTLEAGQSFDLGSGARLEVLSASERGAMLLLQWDNFRALLPINPDFNDLENMEYGRTIGRVDLLLLADSGYAPLNPPVWLSNLAPSVAWVAGGEPLDPEISDALQAAMILRVTEHGWLRVSTDGTTMWLASRH